MMKIILSLLVAIFTISCSPGHTTWVIKGVDALPVSIDTRDTDCGGAGGKWIRFYTDKNGNGDVDYNEVLSSFTICNGTSPGVGVVPSTTCPNGGFKFTIGDTVVDVCNGEDGPQGPKGEDGEKGMNADILPVTLCPGDSAPFPEFGLKVGTKLYAVYYDASNSLGFLAEIKPGNYVTTNGSNCKFTVNEDGTTKGRE